MIAWLSGIVRIRDPLSSTIVLDVGGVGYQITVSWQTFVEVPEEGEPCTLHIHTHVREDVLALYGFATAAERQMFRNLVSVPQVGPRNAIGVLGGFPLPELLQAIADGERATLERIPGVGKRTAERILLDLRDKAEAMRTDLGAAEPASRPSTDANGLDDEARAVLTNLGWKLKPVDAALQQARSEDDPPTTLDALVRRALALLMTR